MSMQTPTPPVNIELPHKAFILPSEIPMWPPAWWTWLVIAAVLIIFIGLLFGLIRRHKQRAYRREALALLQADLTLPDKALLQHCHELIRRCLISEHNQPAAAYMTHELIQQLDKHMPAKKQFANLGQWFLDGQYQAHLSLTTDERTQLLNSTEIWLRKHHA